MGQDLQLKRFLLRWEKKFKVIFTMEEIPETIRDPYFD